MAEKSPRTVPSIPPVVASLALDAAATMRLQEGLLVTHAKLAAPFLADFQAKMATSITALPAFEGLKARMAASVMSVPAFSPAASVIPVSALRSPVVTSNAALANRIENALDRNAAFVVSTMASSVAPVAVSANNIDANVATIAKPRYRRLSLVFQFVGMFTVLVGAADAVVHLVYSLIH